MALVLGVVTFAVGCGANTVDPAQEAEVLVATCRSWLSRNAGRVGGPDQVAIDVEALEEMLRTEPGGDERTVAGTLKDECEDALREAADERAGPDGS